jgi:hypothetical protein
MAAQPQERGGDRQRTSLCGETLHQHVLSGIIILPKSGNRVQGDLPPKRLRRCGFLTLMLLLEYSLFMVWSLIFIAGLWPTEGVDAVTHKKVQDAVGGRGFGDVFRCFDNRSWGRSTGEISRVESLLKKDGCNQTTLDIFFAECNLDIDDSKPLGCMTPSPCKDSFDILWACSSRDAGAIAPQIINACTDGPNVTANKPRIKALGVDQRKQFRAYKEKCVSSTFLDCGQVALQYFCQMFSTMVITLAMTELLKRATTKFHSKLILIMACLAFVLVCIMNAIVVGIYIDKTRQNDQLTAVCTWEESSLYYHFLYTGQMMPGFSITVGMTMVNEYWVLLFLAWYRLESPWKKQDLLTDGGSEKDESATTDVEMIEYCLSQKSN